MSDREVRSKSAEYVAASWRLLAPHVRETIITFIDACLLLREANEDASLGQKEAS